MKKLLKLIPVLLALSFISTLVTAQVTTRFTNRNFDERIANKVITSNATVTNVDSVVLSTNEAGIVELTVIGFAKDTAHSVAGKIAVRFNKRRGTCTLGTIANVLPITADAPLTGATFTISVVNNNLYVTVTGVAATSITWHCFLKYKGIKTYGS